jgi:AraC-like DNA-binding protein
MDSVIKPPIIFDRVIFDYEILYVDSGYIEVTIDGKTLPGHPGDVFLFKPKKQHVIYIPGPEPLHQPHIHFDLYYQPDSPDVRISFRRLENIPSREMALFRKDVCSDSPFHIPDKISLKRPISFKKLLMELIEEENDKLPYYETAMKGKFIALWAQLLREAYWLEHPTVNSNWELLTQVKHYLDHQHKQVTLQELASMINLDKYYFLKLFRKAFGVSPIKYHLQARLEKAKECLSITSLSITEISYMFGFDSIHAFSRAFSKTEGISPSQYRKGIVYSLDRNESVRRTH